MLFHIGPRSYSFAREEGNKSDNDAEEHHHTKRKHGYPTGARAPCDTGALCGVKVPFIGPLHVSDPTCMADASQELNNRPEQICLEPDETAHGTDEVTVGRTLFSDAGLAFAGLAQHRLLAPRRVGGR